ncbi:trehalase isoform X1 [Bemisia tabaci]|uniref:trehalase isoform X1 n=1 Tax=Bemisia tabaci TaxID=7038 RepID=UPI00194855C0
MLWQTFPHLLARSANLLLSDQSKAGHNLHIFQLQLLSDHLFWPRRRVNRNNHYFAAGRRKAALNAVCLSTSLDYNLIDDYNTNYLPSCYSKIYCDSELLHDVELAHIYPDSKTFVDKRMKFSEPYILSKYEELKAKNEGKPPSKEELVDFVSEHFEDGDELEKWDPPDFKPETTLMAKVSDEGYKKFLSGLQQVWKILARKIKPEVNENSDRYSLIYVPNGFCIPGGRFRELYYWDTYWIINGLLLSDMNDTAKGIIENLLSLVQKIGFIPNGSRVYYLNRSQPPLLIQMMNNYYKATNDFQFIKKNIKTLTKEFEWWQTNRKVKFIKDKKTYNMFRYYAPSNGPRPESYREDYEIAQTLPSESERTRWYTRIKSAAESGWDFSSRWFIKDGAGNGTLLDVHTPSIIPVDLNAFLHKNAVLLSEWWYMMGDKYRGKYFKEIAEKLLASINEVLWNENIGSWFDYDLINKQHRKYFFPSNIAPLWTESYSQPKNFMAAKVIEYIKREKIIKDDYTVHYHGIPSSLERTGQQWDFPNAWAPVQVFLIQGLDRTNVPQAQAIALKLAQDWVHSNYLGFQKTGFMYEKYNVEKAGDNGGGGEYESQIGFGWSNGVVFEMMDRYATELSSATLTR